jgi:F-box-like
VTIGSLPENVLLEIFDFCQMTQMYRYDPPRWWHALVHVCRRWRYIVFESPLRLHLQLLCNAKTPVKKSLNVWPRAIPIVIEESILRPPQSGANVIAAIEHHDRVSEIDLYASSTLMKQLHEVMKKPYPVLTRLRLYMGQNSAPVLRGTFLGGSAPRLKELSLTGIPFPALPKLLSSCHDLVDVELRKIPDTGYISPETMATALSALTKLKFVYIGFESRAASPDPTNRPPSLLTRGVLPALTRLEFHGSNEYFDDLVARIDTPAIISVHTWFFFQFNFDIPHLLQFIGRTQMIGPFKEADLYFGDEGVNIRFGHCDPPGRDNFQIALSIMIFCHGLDRQVVCAAQICGKISPFLSNVKRLLINSNEVAYLAFWNWKDHVDNPRWLEIFHAFSALQHMQIPPKLGGIIASALRELTGERVMDALPMLRHLYLPSFYETFLSTRRAIEPFISSRQHSNHPVTAHLTEMD